MVSAKSSGKKTVDLKTKPGKADIGEFVGAIDDAKKRGGAERLIAMMKEISGEDPVMWGSSIIGFGCYAYNLRQRKNRRMDDHRLLAGAQVKGSPQPRAGRRTRR